MGRSAQPRCQVPTHIRITLAGVREQSLRWGDARRPRFGESAERRRIREIEDGAMTPGEGHVGSHKVITGAVMGTGDSR